MTLKTFRKIGLTILGLSIVYVALGIFLVETDRVKEWPLPFNGRIANSGGSHHGNATAGLDAGIVFLSEDDITVKSIIKEDSNYIAQTKTYSDKDSVRIECKFEKHPEWNFTTRLKDSIKTEPSIYSEATKLIAISDIEGEFEAFRNLLIGNNVINEQYEWTFNEGHLVLVGDFFDRGTNVTEVLWLLYHLEQEAERHGGKVHFILGNHEIMNMQNDVRYVSNKYLENAKLLNSDYTTWHKPNTELGRWLASKNIIERIGDIVFVHGGISEQVNSTALNIPDINTIARPLYYNYTKEKKDTQNEYADILFSSKSSPFWYRGYAKDDATLEQVNKTLSIHNASKIIIGHSTVDKVTSYFDGKVINIDTKHSKSISEGILYTDGKYFVVNKEGVVKELQ